MTQWLRQALKSTTLTQAAIARHLNVDPSLISHWMAGRQVPAPRHFMSLWLLLSKENPKEFGAEKELDAWHLLAQADRTHSTSPETA